MLRETQKDARITLAVQGRWGGGVVLQRGAGKTHTLEQNFKEPVVVSKMNKREKGPSARGLGDKV